MTQAQALVVLARPWQAGRMRSRLGDPIGPEALASLEYATLSHVWSIALQVQARQQAHAWLMPIDANGALGPAPTLPGGTGVVDVAQTHPEQQLLEGFRKLFRDGYGRILMIGTHCLGLSPALIAGAFQALSASEVVTGPSADGRVWLLGMRQLQRRLLDDLRWDDGHLFDDLIFRSSQATLSTLILPIQVTLESAEDARAILGTSYAERLPEALIGLLRQAGGIHV